MAKKRRSAKKKRPAKRKKKAPKKKKAIKKKRTKAAKKTPKRVKGKRGQHYSAKQQTSLLKQYHDMRKSGTSAEKAAKRVGVSYLTLLKWEKKSGKKIKTKRGRPPGKPLSNPKRGRKKRGKRSRTAKGAERHLKKALKAPKKRGRQPKAKKPKGLTLVTPTGFKIEGITPQELIKVLKTLR